jgi:hypothetical protein
MMKMFDSYLGIVIPFSSPRQDLLDALPKLRLVKEHVLFVRTVDQLQVEGELNEFNNIVVGSEINIQRWWNLGISFFHSRGYEYVMLANDDITWNFETIYQCVKKTQSTSANLGKVLPSNGGQWGHAIFLRLLPTGGKVLLSPANSRGTRQVMKFPDQTFRWFFGDGDLERQHRQIGSHAVLELDLDIYHVTPNRYTRAQSKLQSYAKRDEDKYLAKWKIEKFKRTRTYLVLYSIRLTVSKAVHNLMK